LLGALTHISNADFGLRIVESGTRVGFPKSAIWCVAVIASAILEVVQHVAMAVSVQVVDIRRILNLRRQYENNIILILLAVSCSTSAWDGYDYENGTYVEIDKGNLM
jgi:hypothetical protein